MAGTAARSRSFPTLSLVVAPFRWIAASRRRIWTVVVIFLAMSASPVIWWLTQLVGLPDIGDPFDVAAFRAMTIPDDGNAFVLYRRAAALYQPLKPKNRPDVALPPSPSDRWSEAEPRVVEWAEQNRPALDLYRQAAQRPDALDRAPEFVGGHGEVWEIAQPLNSLCILAMLEGARMEEQGDMAGAWGWYRAVLRTIHHVGMHGTVYRRRFALSLHKVLLKRLSRWTADPRTTPALIRQARDDAVACESLAPSESYTLRAEYVDMDRLLNPTGIARQPNQAWLSTFARLPPLLTPDQFQSLYDAWQFWRREPDRTRRVFRLVTANWLACYDLPRQDRPGPDLDPALTFDFYPLGADAPANARVLSARSLNGWLDSASDATFLLDFWGWNSLRFLERRADRDLLILLGTQLFRRDHGTDPPSPEALVGPYLERLPEEMAEGRDEAIPTPGKTAE